MASPQYCNLDCYDCSAVAFTMCVRLSEQLFGTGILFGNQDINVHVTAVVRLHFRDPERPCTCNQFFT